MELICLLHTNDYHRTVLLSLDTLQDYSLITLRTKKKLLLPGD